MTINKNTQIPKPQLTINISDRFYLAALLRENTKSSLFFVYTLFLLRDAHGAYPMQGHMEAHTYQNLSDAEIYYKTLMDIIDSQRQTDFGAKVHEYYEARVKDFYKMSR